MTTQDLRQLWQHAARTGPPWRMQNHAPVACTAKNRGNRGKWHNKTGIQGAGLGRVLSLLLAAQCANNTVETHADNNHQKNRCPRIFINER